MGECETKHRSNRIHCFAIGVLLVMGCSSGSSLPDDGSPCAEARALVNACGVSVGLLLVEECTGPSLLVAECIVEYAQTCDSLAMIDFQDCAADVLEPGGAGFPVPLPPVNVPTPEDPNTDDTEESLENTDAACSDEIDNDDDGFVDCDDVDCSHGTTITVC